MFLFFKQKTAYEMRISDWSSDVCSSDLNGVGHRIAVEADSSARVVIRRNRKCDIAWIGVGVEHRDHRNAKRVGFLDRQLFLVDVDDERHVGQAAHVADAAQRRLELVALARHLKDFLLREAVRVALKLLFTRLEPDRKST